MLNSNYGQKTKVRIYGQGTGGGQWIENYQEEISGQRVVQSPSPVPLFATLWTAACQASLSLMISWSLPKFMFITLVIPSSHLLLCRPLLFLPLIFPSIRDFSNKSVCI